MQTVVVSDFHLSDAEPPHPTNPYWKRFKHKDLFVDETFQNFLIRIQNEVSKAAPGDPIELVLNGDIFDFDSVLALPNSKLNMSINWLEKLRGLNAEEKKSKFKIDVIIRDHPVFFDSLREFVLDGNRIVVIVGNHDIELHWPSVQQRIMDRLALPADVADSIQFCEWFYISEKDTLIEHGNQYDVYCVCNNPIFPLVKKGNKEFVRLPFGNLAAKYMINGMGLMNPHVESSFIKPFWEYLSFFFRYLIRTQPLIAWSWIWGAVVTMFYSISEGLLPAMKDPLTAEYRVDQIAKRSQCDYRVVRALRELHVHPAIFNPLQILRELWLDRLLFFVLILIGCFQVFTVMNLFTQVSFFYWFIIPLLLLLPLFVFYARSVGSDMERVQKRIFKSVPLSAKIAKVNRVVHGHTHIEQHTDLAGVEYLNTGTWSPAYYDVECTMPYGHKVFAWIHPQPGKSERVAELYEWHDPDLVRIAKHSHIRKRSDVI